MTLDLLGRSDAYTSKGAIISPDGRYRYLLWREWRDGQSKHWRWWGDESCVDANGARIGSPEACVFIMLNPSTADGDEDDPTIRRCVNFAKREGYERLEVVNLFAHRATNPKELLALTDAEDPVGWRNQSYFQEAVHKAGVVICAWGTHGRHLGQNETSRGWINSDTPLFCLGRTRGGAPSHPLYLKNDAPLLRLM